MESSAQRAAWEALTKSDETNAARRAEPGCCLNPDPKIIAMSLRHTLAS